MSGSRETGTHPLNPGCIHDRVTAPSSATVDSETPEVPPSVTSPRDTSGSANSLETQCHADSPQSIPSVPKPPPSLSDTMDKLLRNPPQQNVMQPPPVQAEHHAVPPRPSRAPGCLP